MSIAKQNDDVEGTKSSTTFGIVFLRAVPRQIFEMENVIST
jgi:hypothetical protein